MARSTLLPPTPITELPVSRLPHSRFKDAEVVMIEWPCKHDLSKTRAWKPISLLSCFDKGLERLVACRLAWAPIRHGTLHPQCIGAQSAVDLVTALVHDIDPALAHGQVATLVTMDVQEPSIPSCVIIAASDSGNKGSLRTSSTSTESTRRR